MRMLPSVYAMSALSFVNTEATSPGATMHKSQIRNEPVTHEAKRSRNVLFTRGMLSAPRL